MTTHIALHLDQVDFLGLAEQLHSDAPLDRATRDLVAYLLISYYGKLGQEDADHARKHRSGRSVSVTTWAQAMTVAALMERFGVGLDVALAATLPRGTASDHDRVSRAYRKLKAEGAPPIAIMSPEHEIRIAAARLQSGNK
jgi:hypothetical protein